MESYFNANKIKQKFSNTFASHRSTRRVSLLSRVAVDVGGAILVFANIPNGRCDRFLKESSLKMDRGWPVETII